MRFLIRETLMTATPSVEGINILNNRVCDGRKTKRFSGIDLIS